MRLRSQGLLWREVADQVGMTTSGVISRWRLLERAWLRGPDALLRMPGLDH